MNLIDIAIARMGNAELAAAVRELDDHALGEVVRASVDLRRLVIAHSLRASGIVIPDGDAAPPPRPPRAKKERPVREAAAKKPRPTEALRKETAAPAPNKKREAVLDAIRAAGAEGITGPEVAERVGITRIQVSPYLTKLKAAGLTRSTGAKAGTRWFDASA